MLVSHWSDCRTAPWLVKNSWRHIRPVTLRLVNRILFLSLDNGTRCKIFNFRLKSRTVRLATISLFVVFHSPHHANTTSLTALYGSRNLRSPLFCDITQRMVVIPWRCLWRTGWYNLQGSENSRFLDSWISWPLKMGPIGYPKILVRNYHHSLRSITELPPLAAQYHRITTTRCAITKKSANITYFTAEA